MELRTKNVEFYFGRGVGMIIEGLLAKAKKRVWVVSPWISEKYARALNKLASRKVDVKVVTSDDYNNWSHRRALDILFHEQEFVKTEVEETNNGILAILGLLFFLAGLGSVFTNVGVAAILLGIGTLLAIIYFGTSSTREREILSVKPYPLVELYIFNWGGGDEQLHSKIYIIDDVAIIGSANLTESGLFRNIEFVAVIRNPELIKEIEDLFEEIVEHPIWEKREIEEVYEELKEHEKNTTNMAKS